MFLPRLARFHCLTGLRHECTATVFHKSAGVYPTARVSSLIPGGNDATSVSCARVNATFCICVASRRQNDKSWPRTLHRNLFAVVRIAAESALQKSPGRVISGRFALRRARSCVAVLCPASQMLRLKKCFSLKKKKNIARHSLGLGFIINCKKIFRDSTDFFSPRYMYR